MPSNARTWPAALTLFFMAALIPETVATFNSPPLLLLTSPLVFLFISCFYGSVALLVREYLRRNSAGWTALLLLGAAAGSINEGIIAGTWYEAQYPGYAMIGSFDPAVAVGLTVFHVLVSTVLPIFLIEVIFPDVASRPWLRPRGIIGCLTLVSLTAASGFGSAGGHRGPKLAVLACVVVAVTVALALPGRASRDANAGEAKYSERHSGEAGTRAGPAAGLPVPTQGRLRLAGAAATVAFYFLFAIVPGLIAAAVPAADRAPWQALLVILMTAFFCFVVGVGRVWVGRAGWGQRQTLAVITGVLLPTIIASVILPAALRSLEPLATLPLLALLGWLSRRQRTAGGGLTAGRGNGTLV